MMTKTTKLISPAGQSPSVTIECDKLVNQRVRVCESLRLSAYQLRSRLNPSAHLIL